jgi:hypothetical protein
VGIARYIRLTFDRNHDPLTKMYRVYRSTDPHVSRNSTHVMDIMDPGQPNPIRVTGEVLKQITTRSYKMAHKNVFPSLKDMAVNIYVNGEDASSQGFNYTLDLKNGVVKFNLPLPKGSVVTADYSFDGIQVIDYDVPQTGVRYYGPVAQDRSKPGPPRNLSIVPDPDRNRIVLTYQPGTVGGQKFYYRIEATDGNTLFSELSKTVGTYVYEGYADHGYVIEKSMDGQVWSVIARTNELQYADYGVDKAPLNAVSGLTASVQLNEGQGTGNVTLTWENPLVDPAAASGLYRVRVISQAGIYSDPTDPVGPVYLATKPWKIVIRRKKNDGSVPSYDGSDAITVTEITDMTQNGFVDVAPDKTEWCYAVYRVDRGGNYSMASTVVVPIGDATPPAKVTGVQVATYSIII